MYCSSIAPSLNGCIDAVLSTLKKEHHPNHLIIDAMNHIALRSTIEIWYEHDIPKTE